MSRYLKIATATSFTTRKTFSVPGCYSFTYPATAQASQVIVFGGGGNSCSTTINGGCVYGFFSGAGGGFTQNLFTGVGGSVACAIVGCAEGSSSFCVSGLGTITATGGTGSGTSTRTTTGGCGSGGTVNTCGGTGACKCTTFCVVSGSCCYWIQGAGLSGGQPGSTVVNGCNALQDFCYAQTGYSGGGTCLVCYCCCSGFFYYFGYYGYYVPGNGWCAGYNCSAANNCISAYTYCNVYGANGACPITTCPFYGYDWDITGGPCCYTGGSGYCGCCTIAFTGATTYCSYSYANNYTYFNFCVCCSGSCCYISCAPSTVYGSCCQGCTAGVAGAGGPGVAGGNAGGGAGILAYYFGNPVGCYISSNPGCLTRGGYGLIIVYY